MENSPPLLELHPLKNSHLLTTLAVSLHKIRKSFPCMNQRSGQSRTKNNLVSSARDFWKWPGPARNPKWKVVPSRDFWTWPSPEVLKMSRFGLEDLKVSRVEKSSLNLSRRWSGPDLWYERYDNTGGRAVAPEGQSRDFSISYILMCFKIGHSKKNPKTR